MSKGMEWYSWVLFVILAVVLIFSLFTISKESFNFLKGPEAVSLEQAIACSHLRCVEGCLSARKLDTDTFQCSQFCNADWTDTKKSDGKICGDNAKAHPVEAIVASTNGEIVDKSKLTQLTQGIHPIASISYAGNDCSPGVGIFAASIEKDTSLQTSGNCGIGCFEQVLVASNSQTSSEKYYIWTMDQTQANLGQTSFDTVVCSNAPQVPNQLKGCGDLGGICRVTACASNEEQIQGTCPHPSAGSAVCCKSKS